MVRSFGKIALYSRYVSSPASQHDDFGTRHKYAFIQFRLRMASYIELRISICIPRFAHELHQILFHVYVLIA